jgi:dienelactone hydrolase
MLTRASFFAVLFPWVFTAAAQDTNSSALPPFTMPAAVQVRSVDFYSEGARLSGSLFSDRANAGKRLPAIIMAQGWGGTAASLEREAAAFAEAGSLVLTFDYRGWGKSDSRIILTGKREPAQKDNWRYTAEVRSLREVVAPLDFVMDWQNAINFIVGEPQCDPQRLGLWGTSLSGGLVVSAAARDPRVKAVHSQVPALEGRWVLATAKDRGETYAEATQRSEGLMSYPEPGTRAIGLLGAPVRAQFASWFPVEDVARIPQVALQFVVAEKDTLVDNPSNGLRAYELAKGPKRLIVIPGINHFAIYQDPKARFQARDAAIAWFDQYVKGAGEPSIGAAAGR